MTQFKEKSSRYKSNIEEQFLIKTADVLKEKGKTVDEIKEAFENPEIRKTLSDFLKQVGNIANESVSVGLFDYPVLMAADILLYGTTHVPVGEDQKQHVELARDLAIRFNSKFGETFTVPEPIIRKESARIMGLDDPTKKMSKSASSPLNYIAITDDAATITNKIKRAVTDSGSEIKASADKPAMTNLLNIFSEVTGKTVSEIEKDFAGKGYDEFKEALAEAVISYITPIQEKYEKVLQDKESLEKILITGSQRAGQIAKKTLADVKQKIGLGF